MKRLSQSPGGRSPRFHQTWQVATLLADARLVLEEQADALVFMRTLNFSAAAPGLFLKAACAAGSFCGWLGRAFCREKPEPLQQRPERPGMQALAEPLLADAGQILAREGRKAARLRIGAVEHDAHQLGLLLGVKRRRTPIAPAVGKPIDGRARCSG